MQWWDMKLSKCVFLLVSLFVYSQSWANDGVEHDHQIKVQDLSRSYTVFVPAGLPKGKVPLMVVVHGGTGNAHHSSRTMGMNEVAAKNHFLVVYPDGTGTLLGPNRRVWNAGKCCAVAQRKNIEDVRFFAEMIKKVAQDYPVDTKRVYLTGESNGAMMTYRLVCELPDVFAAAIPVSGTLMIDNCKAGQKIALFDVHGSADESVPYHGGRGKGLSRADYRSVPESLRIITELRKCSKPTEKLLANGDIETNYVCQDGAPVRALLIKNGGHAWPVASGGGKNSSFSASQAAWDFARRFSR